MSLNIGGGKNRSRSTQTMDQTQTNTLSDRAAGLLTGGMTRLGGRAFQGTGEADIARFQNPYERDVIDATMADLGQQRGIARASLQDQIAKAGAFGDSRRGILEAQLEGELDRNTASALAAMRAQGFDRAVQTAQGETMARNQYDLGIEELIARLASGFANEGTTRTTGTQTERRSGSQLGFTFNPFAPSGGR